MRSSSRPTRAVAAESTDKLTLLYLTILCLSAALLASGAAVARADEPVQRTVSVTGEATERLAPDMATLNMAVLVENLDVSAARQEADRITGQVLSILDAAQIDRDDVNSTGLSIQPQYRWVKQDRVQELVAYRVSRDIEVRLLDLEKLGELVIALSDTGINRMQPPQLGLLNREKAYQTVLQKATANALERAEVIASTLGESLAGVMNMGVQGGSSFRRPQFAERYSAMAADSAAMAPAESYSAGDIEVSVSVSATFLLD